MDGARLREATRHWVTGVGVITTAAADGNHGALVNNIACLSMEPPRYLACFGNSSKTLAGILASRCFNIHFLARGQQHVALAFGAREGDKFAGVMHETGQLGAPVLSDVLACLECEVENALDAGGSTVVIGRVHVVHQREGEPLVMHGREFVAIA